MASQIEIELPALDDDARAETGERLQSTLVELIALSLIGKQLHWNITGHGFRDFHLHLDELVDEWRELSDTVPRRFGSWLSASQRPTSEHGNGRSGSASSTLPHRTS